MKDLDLFIDMGAKWGYIDRDRWCTPQSTEGPYLDHSETTNEPIEKVYVTTLVTTMGLFKYVDGGNSKITPKK